MLALTRYPADKSRDGSNTRSSIMIGDDIEIIILESSPGRVRVAISAPREVPIHRREIYDLLKSQRGEEVS